MSASLIDVLKVRRSVPPVGLVEPGPTAQEVEVMLGVAARVPDHGKLAPWRFVVFEGEARLTAGDIVAAAFQRANPDAPPERVRLERHRLAHAPCVIAVVSRAAPDAKIPEWEQVLSAGAVCMNLVVAANALGFATAWLTNWFTYDADVRAGLGLSPHERIAGFIHIGRAALAPEAREDRARPALADIVTHFGAGAL